MATEASPRFGDLGDQGSSLDVLRQPEFWFSDRAVPLDLLRQRAFNLRWAEQTPDVIPLTAADPDFPAAFSVRAALHAYIDGGLFSYGPAGGLPAFREAVATHLRERRAAAVEASGVIAVNSAAAGLALLCRHWLRPGDEAIILDPVDFLFEHCVRAAGAVPVRWPLGRHDRCDTGALAALLTPRTRLLCLCNPHNPLGRCFTRAELEGLGRLCLERGIRVLSDEVWSEIVYPPTRFTSWLALPPELAGIGAVVYGFSKGFALAGLRLGYVALSDAEAAARLLAASDQPSTVDGVSTLSQVAGIAACEAPAQAWLALFLQHLQARRDQTLAAVAAIPGLEMTRPDATYVAWLKLPPGSPDAETVAASLLERQRLAVVPGSPRWFGPGAAGHLRLCFATSEALLAEGLGRLSAGLRQLLPGSGAAG
ncbi:MAG: pyridoxal phosphate-dependent aminotransferase [Synechococcaceae cyanobacterium]|nr:pyridoxal phosphate-dependent aminotransferase [Synechococcaceae cyanobacterium]